ncbi:MAG: phosphate ABC transporter permease PstA [Myxococcales bacterium]|nr:phosphate ABC transporter permease PstA [Myxococcales bacterium]MDD9964658.1 phosphate ABC transporter permease PstA [Myxococcales bacterium]
MTQGARPRRRSERAFLFLAVAAVVIPLACLVLLLADVLQVGLGRIDLSFFTSFPSRKAELAGILPGLVGSVYLVLLTAAVALPLGIGAAIYLEEYGSGARLAPLIEVNVANLAGVPSIIYGLLGLGVFVRALELGRSLISGALTMALLVLPMVVVVSREALRTVPHSLREASLALGATRWQTIRRVVLPSAYPAILTGVILAISRAFGETAPLVVIGALTYVTFVPDGVDAPFTVLPIQIFNWVSRPQESFLVNAAAGIVVLLVTMLLLNATAVYLRERLQKAR